MFTSFQMFGEMLWALQLYPAVQAYKLPKVEGHVSQFMLLDNFVFFTSKGHRWVPWLLLDAASIPGVNGVSYHLGPPKVI